MSVPILDITAIEQLSKTQLIDAINWLIIHDFEKIKNVMLSFA
mgnify:CR=1 FL=1